MVQFGSGDQTPVHVFYLSLARTAISLGVVAAAYALFHGSLLMAAAAVIGGPVAWELIPGLPARSELRLLVAEWAGLVVVLAFAVADLHLSWWLFAAVAVGSAAIRAWQVDGARRAVA